MTTPSAPPPPTADRRLVSRLGLALAAAVALAYAGSFAGAFVFDDYPSLLADNPSLRRLWPLFGDGGPLSPPSGGLTVSGRPLANLTFALNFAFGRFDPAGYHAVNLAIHAAAALALFGFVRRLLLLATPAGHAATPPPGLASLARFAPSATPLAFLVALLWALHPLQTESVTYLVQRTESLAGLFILLTLYCFLRAIPTPDSRPSTLNSLRWLSASAASCLLGAATKEIAAAAPLLVLLCDRTFVSGTFAAAWRARRGYYLALAATWLLLAWLIASNPARNGTVGFDTHIGPWSYALTQCRALLLYAKLSFWPHPLLIDYGYRPVAGLAAVWPQAALVLLALAGTGLALVRRSALGFAGAWFFLILAPSSSFVPVATQTLAEHRMYLPLAALVAPAVFAAWTLWGRRTLVPALAAALLLGSLTAVRNTDYASAYSLWRDAVEKFPANARAHHNLGFELLNDRLPAAALVRFRETLRLAPDSRNAHFNIARALVQLGRLDAAIPFYEEALRRNPTRLTMRCDFAEALGNAGRLDDALAHYAQALRQSPQDAFVHFSLATTLARNRRGEEALPHFATALDRQPDFPEALSNLGDTLLSLGRPSEAAAAYIRCIRLQPTPEARHGLARILLANGRILEALSQAEAALALAPGSAAIHATLAAVLVAAGRASEADAHFLEAARLEPNNPEIRTQLGARLATTGRLADALPHFEAAVELQPGNAAAAANLGKLLAALGRFDEAIACLTQAATLAPTAGAHVELADALARAGRTAEAAARYEAALALDPAHPAAQAALARLRSAPPPR